MGGVCFLNSRRVSSARLRNTAGVMAKTGAGQRRCDIHRPAIDVEDLRAGAADLADGDRPSEAFNGSNGSTL